MLIGLDAGTSVVKAVAFSDEGEVLAVAGRPTTTRSPCPGWAEQDIEEVIASAGAVLREVGEQAGAVPSLIGISGQGDGLWLLDERGRPVRPAILWSDARAAAVLDGWLASGLADELSRRSGNSLFPGAAAPLLAYLQRAERETLERAATAGYCKDAIVQRLTGIRATDASDASLPFLDVRTRRYDPDLLRRYGVAEWTHLLAPVDPAPGPLRPLVAEGAELTGLPVGTPVHGGPFDLVATSIGAGLRRPGDGLVIIGTTLGCGVLIDEALTDDLPAGMTLCLPEPDRWVRVMPAMVGTPTIEWVLALVGAARTQLDDLLNASRPGAQGTTVLPFLSPAGERAPFVDPAARGQVAGLSLETTGADLVRAVCEGIAYAARHCLETAGLVPDGDVFICGGGTRSGAWRQILADVLGRPLRIARQPEVGARGAAIAALQADARPFDLDGWTRPDGYVEPRLPLRELYDAGYAHYLDRIAATRGHWRGPVAVVSSVPTHSG